MSVTVYYFDGSDGCDRCAALTGYTLGELPERPHEACDCTIEEYALDDCDLVFKNLSISQDDSVSERSVWFESCDFDGGSVRRDVAADEVDHLNGLGDALAEEYGLPTESSLEVEIELPDDGRVFGSAVIDVTRTMVTVEAEEWLSCTLPSGETLEVNTQAKRAGYYALNTDVEVSTVDTTACP